MKRKCTMHWLSFILVFIILATMTIPVFAAAPETLSPQASAYITSVYANTTGGSGSITVYFSITGKNKMTSLGATRIVIYDTNGTPVKTYKYDTTSGMMGYNKTFHSGSVTWYGATSGSKYYAIVGYKAADSSGSDTTTYTTGYAKAS